MEEINISNTDIRLDRLSLDAKAKMVVSFKPFLAEIIRDSYPELRNLTREEIISMIPGEGDQARMGATEMKEGGEKSIYLDTRFDISGEDYHLIMAVDIQGYSEPDEAKAKRMVYYLSRLIASQLKPGDDFRSLRRTRLAWFDLQPSEANRCAVLSFDTAFLRICGGEDSALEGSDIAGVKYYGVDRGRETHLNKVLDMANIIWNDRVPVAERLSRLEEKYNIVGNDYFSEGVSAMEPLS